MNKKIKIGLIIFIFLILFSISILFFLEPKIKISQINYEIKKANYCEIDSDCINAGGKCPFGCYIYINKNEFEKISKLISNYESNCVYDCINCEKAICENNKCKEVCI
ncbi:hypothetical protein EOM09_08320 [bacterium]|nr:hypothetical protein [bacterium]